jgi:selenocysteine lyase/cysteine desulfurase
MTTFPYTHPDYGQSQIDSVRARDFGALDASGAVYLDYTGAALPPDTLLDEHCRVLHSGVFGNPHSDSPASALSTRWMETARRLVLEFFHASPTVYDVVWTANATAALRLVGERYPWTRQGCYLYTADSHNSVIGIRENARATGATVRHLPLQADLRIDPADVAIGLTRCAVRNPDRLFAYPAQCNFSGVQHPLAWVDLAQGLGWDVLVDVAGFVPTNTLELDVYQPEFVAVSFYKMFGWPTGIGALLVRHEALAKLTTCLAGGTVWAATVGGDWYVPAPGHEGFEAGTAHYLAFPAVAAGLRYLGALGMDTIHARVDLLTHWTLTALTMLRYPDGRRMVRLYGPAGMAARGGVITFNFLHPDGRVVDERIVSRAAGQRKISLRTGCFCAPGAGEVAFKLDPTRLGTTGTRLPFDAYLRQFGMDSGGAIRVSYGLASIADDAQRFLEFATALPGWRTDGADLPERVHC